MIFPLYFDADPVVLTEAQTSYVPTTSSVELDASLGTFDVALQDAEKVGTMVYFMCTTGNAPTVTFATSAGGADRDKITFTNATAAACLWTESGWRAVSVYGPETIVA